MELINVTNLSEILEEHYVFDSKVLRPGDIVEVPMNVLLLIADMYNNPTISAYSKLSSAKTPVVKSFIILNQESHIELRVLAKVILPLPSIGTTLKHVQIDSTFKIKLNEITGHLKHLTIIRPAYGYVSEYNNENRLSAEGAIRSVTRTSLRTGDIITYSDPKLDVLLTGMIELDPIIDTIFRVIKIRMFEYADSREIEEVDILNGTYKIHSIYRMSGILNIMEETK